MTGIYPLHEFFCNVDLDVHAAVSSDTDFAELIEGLAPIAYHLERPPGLATFELHEKPVEPGQAILSFVHQIEQLSPGARAFWDAATRRVFDVGFESGQQPHCPLHTNYRLGPDVLAAVARVRCEIAITMYTMARTGKLGDTTAMPRSRARRSVGCDDGTIEFAQVESVNKHRY